MLGLALALAGTTALANLPLTDGLIIIRYKSGGITFSAPTSADGAYQFKGLAAGNYDLSVGGKLVQTLRIDSGGGIRGVLSRQPDGKASITFNGQVGVVPDGPAGAPVVTTRSNKKAGIAKAGEEPLPDVLPSEANSAMAAESPVGFGRGNAGFGGTGPGMVGGGMAPSWCCHGRAWSQPHGQSWWCHASLIGSPSSFVTPSWGNLRSVSISFAA